MQSFKIKFIIINQKPYSTVKQFSISFFMSITWNRNIEHDLKWTKFFRVEISTEKYTNPARGILDFCKQKFLRPIPCRQWTKNQPCAFLGLNEFWDWTKKRRKRTWWNHKRPPSGRGLIWTSNLDQFQSQAEIWKLCFINWHIFFRVY